MIDQTPRHLAARSLKNALTLTTGITARDLLMGWDEQAAMAARAQAHATTAVAFALLDIADALRQQPDEAAYREAATAADEAHSRHQAERAGGRHP